MNTTTCQTCTVTIPGAPCFGCGRTAGRPMDDQDRAAITRLRGLERAAFKIVAEAGAKRQDDTLTAVSRGFDTRRDSALHALEALRADGLVDVVWTPEGWPFYVTRSVAARTLAYSTEDEDGGQIVPENIISAYCG